MDSGPTFTGRPRGRVTRRSVLVADVVSRWLITAGGIGTIIAVCTVCLFLVWVVFPLFFGGEARRAVSVPAPTAESQPLHVAVNEYGVVGWSLADDGQLTVFELTDGKVIETRPLFGAAGLAGERMPTAWAFSNFGPQVIFGFPDGTVQLGTIGFDTTFLESDQVPSGAKQLAAGQVG